MANTPIENDETKVKEFLDRTEIRTMKKDLQKLREGVALKERERIIKIKTPEEEKTEKEKQERIKQQEIEKQLLEKQSQERIKVLQKRAGEEKEAMAQIKNYATEEEKQQIFYLESEKNDLTNKFKPSKKKKNRRCCCKKINLS